MLRRRDLRPYQVESIEFFKALKRCGLFLDMGLGKTASTLTAINDLIGEFVITKTLVIAPLRVARNTWPKEIKKWEHLKELRTSVVVGTLDERIAALFTNADIYIINRENIVWMEKAANAYKLLKKFDILGGEQLIDDTKLRWLIDSVISGKQLRTYFEFNKETGRWRVTREALNRLKEDLQWAKEFSKRIQFDAYLVDESSSFKNKGAQRWKSLRRISRSAEYLALLTGTPSPNTLLELQPQLQLIDGGKRLGESLERFKHQHFRAVDRNGYKWALRKGHDEIIHDAIRDVCLSMKTEDYLQLPDRIDEYQWLDLDAKTKKRYAELEREYIIKMVGGEIVEAVNAAALSNKLLQLSNGAVYDENKKAHLLHDEKIEALKEIVEEARGAPILIAYNYKSDLARLKKAFPKAVVLDKNPATEDRWNRGEIEILLAHPKSAGHGLNLQDGGSIAVWFGLTYSLEAYQQFNKRLHRSGQRRDVYIKHLVCRGTIDELVLAVLRQKDATQEKLLKALRRHVGSVTKKAA